MLVIFCVTLLLLWVFTCAGNALFLLLGHEARNPFLAFFVGLFVIGLVGTLASFFFPLRSGVSVLCFAPAIWGIRPTTRRAIDAARRLGGRTTWGYGVTLCLLAAVYAYTISTPEWLGNVATAFDTDLYHAHIVRWLNEYGTVCGVGNVHSRLANSSTWLVLAALINHGPLHGSVAWIMTPLLLTSFSAYLLCELRPNTHTWAKTYAACLLPVCLYANMAWGLPNLYHDAPSLFFVCLVGCELLHFTFAPDAHPQKHAAVVLICVATAFLMKPLPVVTVACVPLYIVWLLHQRHVLAVRTLLGIITLPACAALIWCVRNLLVSGYPLFPVPLFAMPVDWKMDIHAALQNALDVRAWARMPGPNYMWAFEQGIGTWFRPWVRHTLYNLNGVVMLPPLLAGVLLWGARFRRPVAPGELFFLLWPVLSVIYWFWLAPDPRFGREYPWLFFALAAALFTKSRGTAWAAWAHTTTGTAKRLTQASLVALIVCLLLVGVWRHHRHAEPHDIAWIMPGKQPARPVAAHGIQHPDRAPFTLYVPINDDRCGDAPLPCAPGVVPNLEMRKDGDLGSGFRLRP